jgi:hypothetical protein
MGGNSIKVSVDLKLQLTPKGIACPANLQPIPSPGYNITKLSHSSSREIQCHSWKYNAASSVPKNPVKVIHKGGEQSGQKKQWGPSLIWLHKTE